MKLKKILMVIVLVCIFMCSVNVNAACASGAEVSGEFVCLVEGATGGNSSGTAYPENRVLVLKNYNGGSISFSSGIGEPVGGSTIKLVGDNYITVLDGYGILMFNTGINFIGDGTLTIKSKLPFSINGVNSNLGDTVTEIKIVSGSKLTENTTVTEENKIVTEQNNETTDTNSDIVSEEDDNSNLVVILLVVCCSISLISLLVCVTFMLSNKKVNKQ